MQRCLAAVFILLYCTMSYAENKITRETLKYNGHSRTYYLFVPQSVSASNPAPMIVTFHGSRNNGLSLVDLWKDIASREGIIVAGPDSENPAEWRSSNDGAGLIRDIVEAVKAKYPVDPRRVYVFGHSGGAIYGLYLSLSQSEYFAAVAIHAGTFLKDPGSQLDSVSRKIPIGIWVGSRDPFFSTPKVRETRDILKSHGFSVELTELSGHDHDYYSWSKTINEQVWTFLKPLKLENDPQYLPD